MTRKLGLSKLVALECLIASIITIPRAGEDESSVLIAREVGLAMKAALMRQIGESLTDDPEVVPLKFYHRSLHFAHGMAWFRADITYY